MDKEQPKEFQQFRAFEPSPTEGRICCFWSEEPNTPIPISEAKLKYEKGNLMCDNCKACQGHK